MSTDDFEARLRDRLADLADREDHWDDPLPAARARAAAGVAPDDDPAILPPPAPEHRRRPWATLAVAACVLAVLVGGGFGLRALVSGAGDTAAGSGSAGSAAGAQDCAVPGCVDTGSGAPAAPRTQTPGGVGGNDTAGCEVLGDATSTGPLAGVATLRPSGIVGPQAASGGSAGVPYQLTFGQAGGSAEIRPATAVRVDGGQLCATTGVARPGAVQVVPVAPGAGTSGSATFAAVDSRGEPLPAGEYQLVLVVSYSADGSGLSQLVSAPVTVVVS